MLLNPVFRHDMTFADSGVFRKSSRDSRSNMFLNASRGVSGGKIYSYYVGLYFSFSALHCVVSCYRYVILSRYVGT